MFKIKDTTGETIIRFSERDEWEFNIGKDGFVELLTQEDLNQGKVYGGTPIKKYATKARAMEVVQAVAQAILNARYGNGPKFYVMPDE